MSFSSPQKATKTRKKSKKKAKVAVWRVPHLMRTSRVLIASEFDMRVGAWGACQLVASGRDREGRQGGLNTGNYFRIPRKRRWKTVLLAEALSSAHPASMLLPFPESQPRPYSPCRPSG